MGNAVYIIGISGQKLINRKEKEMDFTEFTEAAAGCIREKGRSGASIREEYYRRWLCAGGPQWFLPDGLYRYNRETDETEMAAA